MLTDKTKNRSKLEKLLSFPSQNSDSDEKVNLSDF